MQKNGDELIPQTIVVTKTFDACDIEIKNAVSFIIEQLSLIKISSEIANQITLCFEEIFSNICSYAFPNSSGKAEISFIYKDGSITINFIDSGIPFNPIERVDPDLSLPIDQIEIGGYGIYLVKTLMDEVNYKYENNSNVLTIKKKIN